MEEKLICILEYYFSLYHADCISRAIFDKNISLSEFKEGFRQTILAEREGVDEYDAFDADSQVKFSVFNERNQFMADFDDIYNAINYKNENQPKNELFSIECEILN